MAKMRSKSDLPTKPCAHCRRPMTWRKAWARHWDKVLYCSDRCRAEAKRERQGAASVTPAGNT
ncbi:DUF2256 domain-containing protein [Aureimonas sp. AU12]|uniref:DUF2256 domain-containing protein n=1 Tax=Aureimonas sp. AU12 TaxID=1638161 RepID=UPI00178CD1A1|nr:DUF2256 domain-containing protein [Aureimonas sp. AU12]